MKVLYYGGQKSGKSSLAEKKALFMSKKSKPFYIATYNNSYNDHEMKERITKHRKQREKKFITIEESFNLLNVMQENQTYLIDCLSMWLLNNLNKNEKELLEELDTLSKINSHVIFVLNNVNEGVIPIDTQSRKFVDMTGIIGQKIASFCDEVYDVKLGIERRLK